MSVRAMTWAWEQPVESLIDRTLLIALADFADDDGTCFPSQSRLAERLLCSVSTVHRALKRLEELKLVAREKRGSASGGRTSDFYRLPVEVEVRKGGLTRKLRPMVSGHSDRKGDEGVTGHSSARVTGHSCDRGTVTEPPKKEPPLSPKAEDRIRLDDHGKPVLANGLRSFWLGQFDGDVGRLDLALSQAAAYVQPNGNRSLEVQVSSQLARIAADKRDRDARYLAAAQAKTATPPAPVKDPSKTVAAFEAIYTEMRIAEGYDS